MNWFFKLASMASQTCTIIYHDYSMGKIFSERKFGEKNGTLDGKVHHIHMDYDPRKENTHWKICQE